MDDISKPAGDGVQDGIILLLNLTIDQNNGLEQWLNPYAAGG